jgi:hypothetical protein
LVSRLPPVCSVVPLPGRTPADHWSTELKQRDVVILPGIDAPRPTARPTSGLVKLRHRKIGALAAEEGLNAAIFSPQPSQLCAIEWRRG